MDYETNTPKFLAWKLVNYYYSAFFYAHSILKVLGFGLVQIDDRIVAQLKQRAASYGFGDAVISRGIYCFSISKSAKVVFYKVDKYSDSHKGLWNRFADLLDVLNAKAVLTGKYDSTYVVKKTESEIPVTSVYGNMPLGEATVVTRNSRSSRG